MKRLLLSLILAQGLIAVPIHEAIARKIIDPQKIEFLLEHRGLGVNSIIETSNTTLLHVAALNNAVGIARVLIAHGADLEAIDNDFDLTGVRSNNTALLLAIQCDNSLEMVKLLVKSKANINATDYYNLTPLHRAAEKGDEDIVRLFIENGATVNAKAMDDRTPLHMAAFNGHTEVLEMLIRHGANVNAVDEDGLTPLHMAAENGHAGVVKILIRYGANVNAVSSYSKTPLHLAAFSGHTEIVKILIRRGANVNVADKEGWTPLHKASFWGYENVIRILLGNVFCDHTIKNDNNYTPEEIARSFDHQEIVDMLHDAPSVNEKIFNLGKGLQILAARVANRNVVTQDQLESLPYAAQSLITNRIEDGEY